MQLLGQFSAEGCYEEPPEARAINNQGNKIMKVEQVFKEEKKIFERIEKLYCKKVMANTVIQ